jgi:hypothetical protein
MPTQVNAGDAFDELKRRLSDVEELAHANRRELDLQFKRIADMQAQIDRLEKRRAP